MMMRPRPRPQRPRPQNNGEVFSHQNDIAILISFQYQYIDDDHGDDYGRRAWSCDYGYKHLNGC